MGSGAAVLALAAVSALGPPPTQCLPGASVANVTPGIHLIGQAIHQITKTLTNVSACANACCGWRGCTSFSFAAAAPTAVHVCQVGDPCCYLHKGAPQRVADGNYTASGFIHVPPTPPSPAPTPAPPPTPPGPDPVSTGSYNLTGLKCPTSTIDVWYPSDLSKGPYPVVSFAHGFGGAPIASVTEAIASLGFVVVGLAGFGKAACAREYEDQLHAISGSRADPTLHPALSHVDWGRAGLIGHSMGGFATSMAAASGAAAAAANVKAAVMSHGAVDQLQTCKNTSADNQCPNGCSVSAFPMSGGKAACTCCTGLAPGTPNISVPVLFTTGSADTTVRANFLYTAFQACPARPKVFVNIAGQYHTTKGEQAFHAHFLACHTAGVQSSCSHIYGKGPNDLCQAKKYVKCEIVTD